MDGWTTSYRWAGVTRGNIGGLVRHDCRDVDLANGVEVEHSNEDIDASMTHLNETKVNDGSGRLIDCTSSQQWIAFLDRRISETQNTRTLKDGTIVPVAVRKDASVAVEFVLQLDPEFTGESVDASPEKQAEVNRLLDVMIDEVVEQMGAENVIGYSKHWDEGHPHVQLMAVPVTDDGQLSMKQKLGAPTKTAAQAKYSALHDSMRERLRGAGYDATDERVDAGKRHLGLAEFKKQRDREEELELLELKLESKQNQLVIWSRGLTEREEALDIRDGQVKVMAREAAESDLRAQEAIRQAEVKQSAAERSQGAYEAGEAAVRQLGDDYGSGIQLQRKLGINVTPKQAEVFENIKGSRNKVLGARGAIRDEVSSGQEDDRQM